MLPVCSENLTRSVLYPRLTKYRKDLGVLATDLTKGRDLSGHLCINDLHVRFHHALENDGKLRCLSRLLRGRSFS